VAGAGGTGGAAVVGGEVAGGVVGGDVAGGDVVAGGAVVGGAVVTGAAVVAGGSVDDTGGTAVVATVELDTESEPPHAANNTETITTEPDTNRP
jgi:hypothetical protein